MKIETLKHLIEEAYDNAETISHFKSKVFKLLDLYENDKPQPPIWNTPTPLENTNDKVPYHTICSCNPQNGGSGICGCTMVNKLVDRVPKTNFNPVNDKNFPIM